MLTLTATAHITKVVKPTKAAMFSKVQPGDILTFKMSVKDVTTSFRSSPGGVLATYIEVKNLTRGGTTSVSQTNLVKRLAHFEYEQVGYTSAG